MTVNQYRAASIDRKELQNGITLYVDRSNHFRSASVIFCIVGGSRLEETSENGMTHLLEHLLFKRTKTRSPREIAFAIDEFGGDVNAFTDTESLCLYGSAVKERGVELFRFLLELLFSPEFTEEDLQLEKGVIRQEILDALDDTEDLLAQEFRKVVWASDPLSAPVFGTVTNLESFTKQNVLHSLQRALCGKRLIVAVSGIAEELLPLEQLTSLPMGERPRYVSRFGESVHRAIKRPGRQTYLSLGWRWPPISSPDYLPSLVLSTLLGHGSSSRFFQILREEQGLCYDVSVTVDAYPDTACCIFSSSFEAASFPKLCQLLRGELERIHREGIPEEEFQRNCRMIEAQLELEEDSPRGRLWRAVESELSLGRYVSTDEVLSRVKQLSAADLSRVARQYLTKDFFAVVGGNVPKRYEEELRW